MTNDKMTRLLAECVDRILEYEEDYAADVLVQMGFTPEDLYSLGYQMPTYSIDEVSEFGLEQALKETHKGEFDGAAEYDGEPITREVLIDYNRLTDSRYTFDGEFIGYGYDLKRLYGEL